MKRKIIYRILSIVALLMVSALLSAQHDYIDSYDSIYKIKLEYLEKLAEEQSKELTELTEYKRFVEWAGHFATKLDENGGINYFGEALYNYYETDTDVEGDIDYTWDYFSPDGIWVDSNGNPKAGTGQGLIISLWINENDLNHIMAGGQFCGGLWETEDGGDEWVNITENEPAIQGISSIFVDPDDSINIFVTTSYDAEGPRGYANGLYYTNDGGTNWYLDSCYTYNPFDDPPSYKYYYPYANANLSPRLFLQNPDNDSIMYLLTSYRLLFSSDKGDN